MRRIKPGIVRRTTRTDQILFLRKKISEDYKATPQSYNKAFADVLRQMADAIEKVKNAWVCPEVVVWMHRKDEITAEVPLSPPLK
jgi:hypothetical protein